MRTAGFLRPGPASGRTRTRARGRWLVALLSLVVAAAGSTSLAEAAPAPRQEPEREDDTTTPSPSAANRAAEAEFSRFCEREKQGSAFFGDAPTESLRARLPAPDNGGADPALLVRLAADAIRRGRFEEARSWTTRAAEASSGEAPRRDVGDTALLLEGLASFLEAEDANCLALHQASSCILPIRPEAVHRNREPILRAVASFTELVRRQPTDPEAIWLLNLSHMLAGSHPDGVAPSARIPAARFSTVTTGPAPPRMTNIAPALGVDARDLAGGAVADDLDGDGFIDLVSSSWDPCSGLRAFRSNGRDGFEEVTEAWNLDGQLGGLNLMHADVDGDGLLDLLVLRGAWNGVRGQVRNSLLLNRTDEGRGFEDVTYAAGLAHPAYPTQAAAFADVDLDGDLDLYVGNESPTSDTDFLSFDPGAARPYPSQLFLNLGVEGGVPRFRDDARAAGVRNLGFAKGVAWGDIDEDGDPDLYVSNIGPNRLFLNRGDGTFEEAAARWGVADPSRTFATWFFDYDNDGDLDLFNADYSVPTAAVAAALVGRPVDAGHPRIYRNDGDRMIRLEPGVGPSEPALPMGANHGDLDGDGFEDLYLGTGLPAFVAIHPNLFFRNLEGRRFENQTWASGLGHLQKGHGVAFADLDHDGDLDLFEQLGGAYPYDAFGNALYRNPANDGDDEGGHRFLVLELRGTSSNRFAVGARLEVRFRENGRSRSVHRLVSSGGSFGGSSFRQELGLGDADAIEAVVVRWPGGETQAIDGSHLELDAFYRIDQGSAPVRVERPPIRWRRAGGKDDADHGAHRGEPPG